MYIHYAQLRSNYNSTGTWAKIFKFPLIRLMAVATIMMVMFGLHTLIVHHFISGLPEPWFGLSMYLDTVLGFFLVLIGYRFYIKLIEKREAYEFSFQGSFKEFSTGFIIGAVLVLFIIIVFIMSGSYKIVRLNNPAILLEALFFFSIGALIQEVVFRVIIFRLCEEFTGSWLAIILIGLFFGFLHIFNENGTIYTSLALFVSDLLLSAAFIFTRRIWMVWGIHAAWNYFQDGIFGMPNSGVTNLPSWIDADVIGAEWFTGGSFGIEGSVFSIVLSIAAGVYLMELAKKRNQIVPIPWK